MEKEDISCVDLLDASTATLPLWADYLGLSISEMQEFMEENRLHLRDLWDALVG